MVTHNLNDIPFSSENPAVIMKAKVEPIGEAEKVTLYPYGCAKLRMTEMPLVK